MDVAIIKDRVAAIKAESADDESAHSDEDRLFIDVLRAIAYGAADAPALAREALATLEIDFSRWCA